MNTPLFDWVLTASLRASLLTAVVLLAQTLLRKRLSASWRHALWLPVLVVLLTPTFPESRLSVGSLLQPTHAPLATPASTEAAAPQAVDPKLVVLQRLPLASPRPAPVPWRKIAGVTWLLGVAGIGGIGLATFLQTLRRFKRSRLPLSGALLNSITSVTAEIGLSKVPRIWMGSAIQSPAVTGLFRPVLLLPADFERTLSPEETRLVLKHELTHILRGDLPLNALLCLLLVLHWLNPVLWIAFFKSRQDREAACDAQVLHRESRPGRVVYGHTLLKVETAFRHPALGLGFVGIFGRGTALRSRVESLLNQPNPHPLMKTALSLSLAVLTFVGVTRAATPDASAPRATPAQGHPVTAPSPARGSIQDKLNRIVLTSVQLRDTTLEDAITSLRNQSVQLDTTTPDPAHKGVNIVLAPSKETSRRAITMQMNNVPLGEALKYVAMLSNLRFAVEPHAVVLSDADPIAGGAGKQTELLVTKSYRLPPEQHRKFLADSSEKDLKEALLKNGVPFPKDAFVAWTAQSGGQLVARNTAENLEFLESLLFPDLARSASRVDYLIQKAQFRDATVAEAVEFIRVKTRQVDGSNKGLNIVIMPGGDPAAKITLDLTDVPSSAALRYIGHLSGHTLSFDGTIAVLTPNAK